MSIDQPDPSSPQPNSGPNPHEFSQDLRFSQVTARVPERVRAGVLSTGAVVLQGVHEFVIDFLLRIAQPHQVAARVVIPFSLMPNLIAALQENLHNYTQRFGPPPKLPAVAPGTPPPRIEEVYEQLRMPEEQMSGAYANAVMIVHTPAEFCFDFITNFFPKSAVSCRVHLAAAHVPRLLDSFSRSYSQYQRRAASAPPGSPGSPPPPPPIPPPPPSSPSTGWPPGTISFP